MVHIIPWNFHFYVVTPSISFETQKFRFVFPKILPLKDILFQFTPQHHIVLSESCFFTTHFSKPDTNTHSEYNI